MNRAIRLMLIAVVTVAVAVPVLKSMGERSPVRKDIFDAAMHEEAPPLLVKKWVKGGPVRFEEGKVYVVAFWGTSSQSSVECIPDLTALQHKYAHRDEHIVGISDEDLRTVKSFVHEQGNRMDYAVAVDDNSRVMRAYYDPFRIRVVPHAFVIDRKGELVWHGPPLHHLEDAIERAL